MKTNRGKDGSFNIFHSAEGCQRYNEPQPAPKLHELKKILFYIWAPPSLAGLSLSLGEEAPRIFSFTLPSDWTQRNKKSDHCPYLTSLWIKSGDALYFLLSIKPKSTEMVSTNKYCVCIKARYTLVARLLSKNTRILRDPNVDTCAAENSPSQMPYFLHCIWLPAVWRNNLAFLKHKNIDVFVFYWFLLSLNCIDN